MLAHGALGEAERPPICRLVRPSSTGAATWRWRGVSPSDSRPNPTPLDQVTVDGVTATQIDARAVAPTNWLVVQGTPSGWGGDERVVLVPLEGSWLVVRGSAFQPDVAFAEDLAPGDGFNVMLDSVDLARLSPTCDGPASRGEGRAAWRAPCSIRGELAGRVPRSSTILPRDDSRCGWRQGRTRNNRRHTGFGWGQAAVGRVTSALGTGATWKAPSAASTRTASPSPRAPVTKRSAMRSSISRWIRRRSGRAPYSGS